MTKTDNVRKKLGEFNETLRCSLTIDEVNAKRKRAVELIDEEERIKLEAKHAATLFKGRMEKTRSERTAAIVAASRGYEERPVTVEEWMTQAGMVERIRIDTGEVIHVRRGSVGERQEALPGVPQPEKPEPPKPNGKGKKARASAPAPSGKDQAAEQGKADDEEW